MSDDLITSAADGNGVDLKEVSAGAKGELQKFEQNIADAIKDTPLTAEKRDGLNKALRTAMVELNSPKSPSSSLANGASVIHPDPFQDKKGLMGAMFDAGAQASNNPVLALVGALLKGDNKGPALQNLQKALAEAGITKIKGQDLNVVFGNAQAHSNTIKAVDSLSRSGITGRLYPPDGQVVTKGGLGQNSEAAFVMQQAFRVNNGERQAVMELTKPPVKISEAQKKINNEMGISAGATTTQVKAKEFEARSRLEERNTAGQISQGIQNIDKGAIIVRVSSFKTNMNDLMKLAPTPPSQNNSIVNQINQVGNKHEATMQKLDEVAKNAQQVAATPPRPPNKGLAPAMALTPNPRNNYAFEA